MHLYAGLLATDADAALDHLRRAVTRNRMVGLRPYEALALHELAKRTSDVGERREASTESRRIAADVGIPWLL